MQALALRTHAPCGLVGTATALLAGGQDRLVPQVDFAEDAPSELRMLLNKHALQPVSLLAAHAHHVEPDRSSAARLAASAVGTRRPARSSHRRLSRGFCGSLSRIPSLSAAMTSSTFSSSAALRAQQDGDARDAGYVVLVEGESDAPQEGSP
jgi:hypothetical protein